MANFRFVQTVPPEAEPVTLQEARDQVRADNNDEDALLSEYIAAARDYCEKRTGLPLMPQTFVLYADRFFPEMVLKPNLLEVVAVRYLDVNGDEQTVDAADYVANKVGTLGSVYPAYQQQWPQTLPVKNAVQVEFKCGFASRNKVPDSIRSAMKLLIGHWFLNREAVVIGATVSELPAGVEMLLGTNKLWSL
ncbi:head-tail connector protein [Methylophaga lonarensis]|uniref:head-tail connector protein n=1 Tax=Methylophaga lonarensis TaxID=999151 RepID=UPI003D2D7F59